MPWSVSATNLFGAPAMTPQEFAKHRVRTVIGVSFTMSLPLGQYDDTRYLNIGRNRWAFKPELGVSTTLGHWTIEGDIAGAFFTDNNDFVNGGTFEQAPIAALQGHLIYTIKLGCWIAADVNFWRGGRLTTNGVTPPQRSWAIRGPALRLPSRSSSDRSASRTATASSPRSAATSNRLAPRTRWVWK